MREHVRRELPVPASRRIITSKLLILSANTMIVFSCPTCQKAMQVPPTMGGQAVSCPFCHNGVIVPEVPPPAPLPPAPPPKEVLSLDDPEEEAAAKETAEREAEEEAERERRVRAKYAAAEAKKRRNSKIYLMLGPVLALIGILCLLALWSTIARDINGAKPIDAAGLANFDEAKHGSPWVVYTPKEVVGTDIGIETKRRRSGTTRTVFVLVPVQDKWLIAQCESDYRGGKLEGQISTFNSGLEKEAVEKVQAKHPDKKGKWLAYQMDASHGGASFGPIAMLVGSGFLVLFGLGCALYGLVSRPKARPQRRRRAEE